MGYVYPQHRDFIALIASLESLPAYFSTNAIPVQPGPICVPTTGPISKLRRTAPAIYGRQFPSISSIRSGQRECPLVIPRLKSASVFTFSAIKL